MPLPQIAKVSINVPRELSIAMHHWDRFLEERALSLRSIEAASLSPAVVDSVQADSFSLSPVVAGSAQVDSEEEADADAVELVVAQSNPNRATRPYALVMKSTSGDRTSYAYIGIAIIEDDISISAEVSELQSNIQDDELPVITIPAHSPSTSFVDPSNKIHALLRRPPISCRDAEIDLIYAIPADNFLTLLAHDRVLFREHQREGAVASWEVIAFTVAVVIGFFWMALGSLIENPLYLMTSIGLFTFICNFPIELLRTRWNHGSVDAKTAKQIAVNSLILAIKFYGGAGAWITGADLTAQQGLLTRSIAAGGLDAALTTLTSMALSVIEDRGVLSNIDYYQLFSVRQRREIERVYQGEDMLFSDVSIEQFGKSYSAWLREHVMLFMSVLLAGGTWVVVDHVTSAYADSTAGVLMRSVLNGLATGFTFWFPKRFDDLLNVFNLYPQVLAQPRLTFSSPEPTADWRQPTPEAQTTLMRNYGAFSTRPLQTIPSTPAVGAEDTNQLLNTDVSEEHQPLLPTTTASSSQRCSRFCGIQ